MKTQIKRAISINNRVTIEFRLEWRDWGLPLGFSLWYSCFNVQILCLSIFVDYLKRAN